MEKGKKDFLQDIEVEEDFTEDYDDMSVELNIEMDGDESFFEDENDFEGVQLGHGSLSGAVPLSDGDEILQVDDIDDSSELSESGISKGFSFDTFMSEEDTSGDFVTTSSEIEDISDDYLSDDLDIIDTVEDEVESYNVTEEADVVDDVIDSEDEIADDFEDDFDDTSDDDFSSLDGTDNFEDDDFEDDDFDELDNSEDDLDNIDNEDEIEEDDDYEDNTSKSRDRPKKQKGSKSISGIFKIVVILLLIAGIVGGGFFIFSSLTDNQGEDTNVSETSSETTELKNVDEVVEVVVDYESDYDSALFYTSLYLNNKITKETLIERLLEVNYINVDTGNDTVSDYMIEKQTSLDVYINSLSSANSTDEIDDSINVFISENNAIIETYKPTFEEYLNDEGYNYVEDEDGNLLVLKKSN